MQTRFSWNSTICFPVCLIFLPGKERCSSRVLATNSIPPRVPLYQSSTHTHCLRRISGAQALCPPHTDDILRTSLPSVPISSVPAVIWLSLTVSRLSLAHRKFVFSAGSSFSFQTPDWNHWDTEKNWNSANHHMHECLMINDLLFQISWLHRAAIFVYSLCQTFLICTFFLFIICHLLRLLHRSSNEHLK